MTAGLRRVRLTGIGEHRPAHREDNTAVAARTESSDEWIRTRSGIATRGIAADDESTVDMAVSAGAKALAAAGTDAADVDLVLLATCSMPGPLPGGAPQVASRLGALSAGAFDVAAGCAGFTYALSSAADAVRAGSARTVLLTASEKFTPMLDPYDRGTAFLFGDGAGAVVVTAAPDGDDGPDGVGPVVWSHDGAQHPLFVIDGSPPIARMEGRALFRWAVSSLPAMARTACERAGLTTDELGGIVLHQANLRIVDAVVRALKLPTDTAVARDVVDSGNTSAASVPLALARLIERGEITSGDPVLLLGFGAGLTAAGQVVRCP